MRYKSAVRDLGIRFLDSRVMVYPGQGKSRRHRLMRFQGQAYLSWFDKSRQKASLNKRDSLVIHAAPSCSWIREINDPRVRHRQHRCVGDLRGLSYGGPCCVHGATPVIFCTVLLVDTSDARRSIVRDSSLPLSSPTSSLRKKSKNEISLNEPYECKAVR